MAACEPHPGPLSRVIQQTLHTSCGSPNMPRDTLHGDVTGDAIVIQPTELRHESRCERGPGTVSMLSQRTEWGTSAHRHLWMVFRKGGETPAYGERLGYQQGRPGRDPRFREGRHPQCDVLKCVAGRHLDRDGRVRDPQTQELILEDESLRLREHVLSHRSEPTRDKDPWSPSVRVQLGSATRHVEPKTPEYKDDVTRYGGLGVTEETPDRMEQRLILLLCDPLE